MPTLPAKELFPLPVCVSSPEDKVTLPEVKVKFLPEAMVVSPLRDTAPVPVPKVLAPVWLKMPLTVTVPLEVSPEVAVIKSEMVGVAVQAVEPKVVVIPALPRVNPVAFVPPTVKLPAESKASVPEVAVEMVKSPLVLVQADVPPEVKVKAPVELPMLVAAVPVALRLPVPVTVIPPVP